MTILTAYIDGIGLLGPGFADWPGSNAVLTGAAAYQYQPTVMPVPMALPPAERRRCGPIIKVSLAVGYEAAAMARLDVKTLPTVFSASGGDGKTCHEICEMLASDDRLISPTRFHNSVHNAASGYWSIAAGAMVTSSVLSGFDASFGAGLLEAIAQVTVDHTPCLLIACDTTYPEPLYKMRPISDEFGIGLALMPTRSERSLAKISVALSSAPADTMADSVLEQLRVSIPAARGLPLLLSLARRESAACMIGYLHNRTLAVELSPCC
ncbi:MAG TPA: 3-oxoacyl-ACP synthase [Oxalobacteraceae bacterium]|jgi:hypothetical protein|nr:3-oxoacyl-ACP synthase [Oxalobacteraceae bacterium]